MKKDNHMNNQQKTASALLLSTALLPLASMAEENWNTTINYQADYGSYDGSQLRDDHSSQGIGLQFNYLDQLELKLYGNKSEVSYNVTSENLEQDEYAARANYTIFSDSLSGRVGLGLYFHTVDNNDVTGQTDAVDIWASSISYSPWDQQYKVGLEYAQSDYSNLSEVHQLTTTVSFAFNDQYDWLNLRGYFISPQEEDMAELEDRQALEVTWQHWVQPDNWLGLDSVTLSAMGGERQFAVNSDIHLVMNLVDVEKQRYGAGLNWKTANGWQTSLGISYTEFENESINDSYNDQLVYISVGKRF